MADPLRLSAIRDAAPKAYRPLRLSDLQSDEQTMRSFHAPTGRPDFPIESPGEHQPRARPSLDTSAELHGARGDLKAAPAKKTPKWAEITTNPEYQKLNDADKEEARLHYWGKYVAPQIPTEDLEGARAEFDQLTQPAVQKAPKVPKWKEISSSSKYQALDDAGRESVRLDYWQNYVSPLIDTDDLEDARKHFDELTRPAKPSLFERAGKAISGAFAPKGELAGPAPSDEPPIPLEEQLASRPARAVATRKGQVQVQPADIEDVDRFDAAEETSARWTGEGGVLTNAPAGMVAAGKNAVANLAWLKAEEERVSREEALTPGSDQAGYRASPQFRKLERDARARHKIALADAAMAGTVAKDWARETRRELELVTPQDMDTTQQAVWSFIQSTPPTLIGLSVGILTRNPAVAMAIAGGGGAAVQAGATYGEAREKGAPHRLAAMAASIDAVLEGVGEAIPLAAALKRGSPFMTRLRRTIGQEAGQEGITQLAQDLNAYLTYNPNITLQEAWQNFKVATLAGAIGGTVYGTVGHAADASRQQRPAAAPAAKEPPAPLAGVDLSDAAALSRRIAGEEVETEAAPSDEAGAALPRREAEAAIERGAEMAARELTATEQEPGAAFEPPVDEQAHAESTVDVFERPGTSESLPDDAPAYVIDKRNRATGRVERKAMFGYSTEEDALRAYLENDASIPRGIKDWRTVGNLSDLAEEQLNPATVQGRKFHRLELRTNASEAEPIGKLRKVVYWPAGKAIPEKYSGWLNDGLWEARWTHGGKWGLWRDFTKGERKVWQGIEAVTARPASEYRPQLETRRAVNKVADEIASHALAGRGFKTIAEARAFARKRMPSIARRTSTTEVLDQALELGATRAATSLRERMRARGATKKEMELAERELHRRLPAGAQERAAVGIALNPPYTGAADEAVADQRRARPDAIRQAIRDLFRVPINEGGFKGSRDKLGLYKVKPRTIRLRNQNDIGVIAHEVGHHFSETSRPVRELMRAHEDELRNITPYAASQRTAALQREEGFAEYLRLRWTAPAQARASAPHFSAAFERYVDQNGYRPAFDAIEGAIRDWQNLPPAERILAKVGEPDEPLGKRFSLDRIVFEVFDRWLPMRRMVEDLKPDIAPSADPFKLAHLLAGDAALIEDWLLRETVPFNFQRRADPADRGKPLAEILKMIPQDKQREFGAYLIAKRANELMQRGKEHLYSADEIAAGLRLETPEFRAAATELYRFNDRLLDYAVEGGLLSAFVADKFRMFPFYVPFFRVGEPIARHGDIFKEIHGGTENLRDPIANVIENTVRVIHATNRNYVLAKAHDLAREVPGGGRWLEGVPMPERAVRIETEKIIETLREQGVEVDLETAETLATTQTFFVKNPLGDERNRIIVVRRSGRAYALQINDEMLWEALERFEPVDIGLVEKILSVPADVLRAGIVLSPEFMARNFARDTLTGFIQSKKGILPVAGTIGGFKEIATRSDAARLYRAFGGAYGDMWRADRGLERKLVERMARRGGFDPRTIITPRGLLSLLHRIGSVTEAGTRVAEFKATMEPGDIDSLIEAAYNAREVSVDFGMHGHSRSVRFLTRITPFLTPALQGWYKAARTGGSAPFTTLLRGGMLTAVSIALFLINRGEDWYDELEQWERNTYWHIDIGLRDERGKVIALRIPKPWEWGAAFGSIPEAIAELAIEQHGKAFLKRLESIVDDVLSLRIIPTSLLVPAELWANKSLFLDRPIVPESKERLPAGMQATAGTSLAARKAGELTDTAPAKIDHAARGLFGTLGVYTMMLADQAIMLVDDEAPETPPLPWQRSPLVRVFFGDPNSAGSRYVTELYELLTEARQAEAAMRLVDREEFKAFVEKHDRELRIYPMVSGAAQILAALRRENERILRSREYSTEEKSRRVAENNERMRAIAKTIVQRSNEAAGAAANR